MDLGQGIINKGRIGMGAFGCVYLVENAGGDQFAVKVMEWVGADPSKKEMMENELTILKELSHEHVLCYVDHFTQDGCMYIVTEYCSGGDLSAFLDHTSHPLPEDLLLVWLWQMACGLEYMHTHEQGPVLHRDLKPGNVFLSEKGNVRLGDVGVAKALEKPDAMTQTFCGTPPYMSPEALSEQPYNAKTDVWSLGCCVVEMATLQRAYEGSNLFLLRNAVLRTRQPLPPQYRREVDALLSSMLQLQQQDRASATQLLDHPLLQHCEEAQPMDLLIKHGLVFALATHTPASPTTSTTTAASSTRAGRMVTRDADDTLPSLSSSLANLAAILDEGEPLSIYRVKVEKRMHGRRQNDDTLTNSNVQTVLYKPPQTVKSKTKKKEPKVPTVKKKPEAATAESEEADDSLSRTVLASMNSTLLTTLGGGGSRRGQQVRPTGADEASSSTQMSVLRRSLAQLMGAESLHQAGRLVGTASDPQELMSGLSSLTMTDDPMLSQILIYMMLKESVSQGTSSGV